MHTVPLGEVDGDPGGHKGMAWKLFILFAYLFILLQLYEFSLWNFTELHVDNLFPFLYVWSGLNETLIFKSRSSA